MNTASPTGYRSEKAEKESGLGSVAGGVADTAADLANKAGAQMERAMETAGATAQAVAERGREATDRVQQVAGNVKGALHKSVTEQPMTTLALAAAVGFLIGALWKR